MGKELGNSMAKKLSKDLSKDIRYLDNIPGGYLNGLWLFIDNKRTQIIVKITSIVDSGRTFNNTVKLGFMNSKNIRSYCT